MVSFKSLLAISMSAVALASQDGGTKTDGAALGAATACEVTVTSTVHPGTTAGCQYECQSGCITDKFVQLPCGCTKATAVSTVTEAVCATQSNCYNCKTAWPFTETLC